MGFAAFANKDVTRYRLSEIEVAFNGLFDKGVVYGLC